MKNKKPLLSIICVVVAIVAIITAIIIFRNEIASCCANLKVKIDGNKINNKEEFEDYADV